ncbi:hypothetical protein [Ferruginibacter profundus]
MENRLILDEAKYRLFIKENVNWQRIIKAQVNEIPWWKEWQQVAIKKAANTFSRTGDKRADYFFYNQLQQQQNQMQKLENDIAIQQQRLEKDCVLKDQYDVDAFCTQDILRDRIKAIEKTFIELKCNFLKYISAIS